MLSAFTDWYGAVARAEIGTKGIRIEATMATSATMKRAAGRDVKRSDVQPLAFRKNTLNVSAKAAKNKITRRYRGATVIVPGNT